MENLIPSFHENVVKQVGIIFINVIKGFNILILYPKLLKRTELVWWRIRLIIILWYFREIYIIIVKIAQNVMLLDEEPCMIAISKSVLSEQFLIRNEISRS